MIVIKCEISKKEPDVVVVIVVMIELQVIEEIKQQLF